MSSSDRVLTKPRPAESGVVLTLGGLLEHHAEVRPDLPALIGTKGLALSYGSLYESARVVVAQLRSLGAASSDRVAIALPKGLQSAVSFVTVASGAVAVPLNPDYRQAEYERYLKALDVRLLLTSKEVGEAAAAAASLGIPTVEPVLASANSPTFTLRGANPKLAAAGRADFSGSDQQAVVFQTSGTTSRPKGVPLSHRNVLVSARNLSSALGLGPADSSLDIMPLFHVHGLVVSMLTSLTAGGSVLCPPRFSPEAFYEWLRLYRPTWYSCAPSLHQAVVESAGEQRDIISHSAIRLIRSSAAPLAPAVLEGLASTFEVPVVEGYGMSECPQISCGPPEGSRPGAVGFPAGPEIRLRSSNGDDSHPGEAGEIWIRDADCVFSGYDDPAETADAFDGDWFRTGDLGRFADDGQLEIVGRVKELINRGGEKIAPREIEDALLAHPGVGQAVVFPVAHPRLGEEVGAAVVATSTELSEEALRHQVGRRLADHKIPNVMHLVSEIPKSPSGKLERSRMAELLAAASPEPAESPQPSPPVDETERMLAGLVEQLLGLDSVSTTANFFELGGDSILAAQLLARARAHFGVDLPLRAFFEEPSVRGTAAAIRSSNPSHNGAVGVEACQSGRQTSQRARPWNDSRPSTGLQLSLFFFSAEQPSHERAAYELLLEASRQADRVGFSAVWTPERHFTTFGGPYPNPSVLGAALAASTERIQIRAGSVVLPLHDVVRVAEEWAVVDNLSGGRVGIACASGWHAGDFIFSPESYDDRKQKMFEQLEQLQRLWRGEPVSRVDGEGRTLAVSTLPRPVQPELPIWLAAHSDETFIEAGRRGLNIVTTLYNTTTDEIRRQVALYRQSLSRHGHDPASGTVTLMVHTFVGADLASVETQVAVAYGRYLDQSLVQQESAGWAFPTRGGNRGPAPEGFHLTERDRRDIIERATADLINGSGLVGTSSVCRGRLQQFEANGVDEVACLIDFGISTEAALESLDRLSALRDESSGS